MKSAVLQNNVANPSVWQDGTPKTQGSQPLPNDDGVIVLSKMDSVLRDPSVQDFVVMVELKYKDKTAPNISCCNQKYNLNNVTVGTNRSSSESDYGQLANLNCNNQCLEYIQQTSDNSLPISKDKEVQKGNETINK